MFVDFPSGMRLSPSGSFGACCSPKFPRMVGLFASEANIDERLNVICVDTMFVFELHVLTYHFTICMDGHVEWINAPHHE